MATTLTTGTLAADNQTVQVDVGNETAYSAVVTGAMSATITFQVLYDPTEGWVSAPCFTRAGVSATSTLTAAGSRLINVATAISLRALIHPYVSGSPALTFAGCDAISVSASSGGGGGASTIADGADVAEGTTTDAPITTTTSAAAATGIGLWKGFVNLLISLRTQLPAALTGSGNLKAAIVESTATVTTTGAGGTFPVTNANLDAALSTLLTISDFDTKTGSLTETAPATDTASSGENGRLQRIAQRLTSLIALLPAALINGALAMTGDTASGVTDAGNPVKQGYLAISHGSAPTTVATGQRVNGLATRNGLQFMALGHPNTITTTVDFTGAQTNGVVVANTAGTKLVVTSYLVFASAANTVNITASVGLAQTVTPATGVAGRLGAGTVAPSSGFGRKTYQAGADGDQLLTTSTGAGNYSVQVEYHTTPL